MARFLLAVMLGVFAIDQSSVAIAQSEKIVATPSTFRTERTLGNSPSALPPVPRGKSTIMGGEIRNVDPVRDELALKIIGQRPVKILFDERTEVFRDGKRIPLRDLHTENHASVQTILDGSDVFAVSIHILSQSPEGEYQGKVLSFNSETSELAISSALSHEPIRMVVAQNTAFVREGQPAFTSMSSGQSDLMKGSLVSVQFAPDEHGRGIASLITILATPGSTFVFSGSLTALDMHSGLIVLTDPRDGKSYQVSFNSHRLPITQHLHEGDSIRVNADFDGTRYVANALTVN